MAKVKITEWRLMNNGGQIPVAIEEGLIGKYYGMAELQHTFIFN